MMPSELPDVPGTLLDQCLGRVVPKIELAVFDLAERGEPQVDLRGEGSQGRAFGLTKLPSSLPEVHRLTLLAWGYPIS
jgi:hypothetical protein